VGNYAQTFVYQFDLTTSLLFFKCYIQRRSNDKLLRVSTLDEDERSPTESASGDATGEHAWKIKKLKMVCVCVCVCVCV
jgi:hypothetical protein